MLKVKVKFTLEQATKFQRWSRVIALLFFNLGARLGGWSTPKPGGFTLGIDPVPLCRRLDKPQGGSGRAHKILPPTGI
jgi:hypothetical protein